MNVQAYLLDDGVTDQALVEENCEPMHDYAMDEPYHWVNRVYQRIEVAENPALNAITDARGAHSFAGIVNAALDSGRITQFKDLTFTVPLMKSEVRHVEPSPIILKVDFAYNDTLHRLQPHIIGLGMRQTGGQLVGFYYPELRFALNDYEVTGPAGKVKLSEYVDHWLFISHAMDTAAIGGEGQSRWRASFFERQSEFDALTSLFILEHEIANRNVIRRGKRSLRVTGYLPESRAAVARFTSNGSLSRIEVKKGKTTLLTANYMDDRHHAAFREFYPDGSLKQQGQFDKGLRSGQWASWFPSGNIKSRRMYAEGRLDGQQRVYHDNGNLMLEYDMVKGEYEGGHKSYYANGHLKTSGSMKWGFVSGEWDCSTYIGDPLKKYMDEDPARFDFPKTAWQDNYLDYHVTYTLVAGDGPKCPLNTCIDMTWPKRVE